MNRPYNNNIFLEGLYRRPNNRVGKRVQIATVIPGEDVINVSNVSDPWRINRIGNNKSTKPRKGTEVLVNIPKTPFCAKWADAPCVDRDPREGYCINYGDPICLEWQ